MRRELTAMVRGEGAVPLSWAGGTSEQDYLNLGDALSPVMVALLSGRPVRRVPFRSTNPRLAAVGTIGQNLAGGEIWVWGTGCSAHAGRGAERARFSPDRDTRLHLAATRGPLSASLLGGGRLGTRVFGDPVWLLPRFYRPALEKRYELGVIVHLSDLADRAVECHPNPAMKRYRVPADGSVRLINTVVPVSTAGMRARIDEILACKRIVSTSLHGMVFAESYGVPCLCFPPLAPNGPGETTLAIDAPLDSRMVDLYMGLGRARISHYAQHKAYATDWDAVMAAIDRAWEPASLDEAALIEAFPVDFAPLAPLPGETIWEHPVLNGFAYSHEVAAVRRADAEAARAAASAAQTQDALWAGRLRGWRLPAVARAAPAAPPRLSLRRRPGEAAATPLAWAAGPRGATRVNLGDALSPVIVAAMTGLPVVHAAFDSPEERLAAVGTIAHGQTAGVVHLWGCGLDEKINPADPGQPWRRPPAVTFHAHATRGPYSAAALRREGVEAPEIFGDPVYLIDRIFPLGPVRKIHDLGVVLHLSELDPERAGGERPAVKEGLLRYAVPPAFAGRVKLIDTWTPPTLAGFEAKLREIASCRAILSTSLHGLVIADVYGVPNAWFGFGNQGLIALDPTNPAHPIDHRVRDLYAGQGLASVKVVMARRGEPSDWDRLLAWSRELEPRRVDVRPLFDAFPGPLAASWRDPAWPPPRGLIDGAP